MVTKCYDRRVDEIFSEEANEASVVLLRWTVTEISDD